jgi:hypothetical protein
MKNYHTMSLLVASSCSDKDLTPDKIMEKIVVCTSTVLLDENQVRQAGGVGLVLVDVTSWPPGPVKESSRRPTASPRSF